MNPSQLFVGLLVALSAVGCRRTSNEATGAAPADAGGTVASGTTAMAAPPGSATATSNAPACAVVATTTIPDLGDYGAVQNVRVAADASKVLVTWEALSVPQLGDTSQVAFAAFGERVGGADVFTTVALPARAYAASVYSTIAPTRAGGAFALFTYGVAGAPSFATYAASPQPWKGLDVFTDAAPAPARAATLSFGVAESLAVASDLPLAVLAGTEAPCAAYYVCERNC